MKRSLNDRAPMCPTMPAILLSLAILLMLTRGGGSAEEVDTDAAARESLFNKAEAAEVS